MTRLISFLLLCLPVGMQAQLRVGSLRVEHLENPAVVDEPKPRLSWVNEPKDEKVKEQCQTAYQVVVASSAEKLRRGDYDLWDSAFRPERAGTLRRTRPHLRTGLLLAGPNMGQAGEALPMEPRRALGHGAALAP